MPVEVWDKLLPVLFIGIFIGGMILLALTGK